jgi:hypothetical protein
MMSGGKKNELLLQLQTITLFNLGIIKIDSIYYQLFLARMFLEGD